TTSSESSAAWRPARRPATQRGAPSTSLTKKRGGPSSDRPRRRSCPRRAAAADVLDETVTAPSSPLPRGRAAPARRRAQLSRARMRSAVSLGVLPTLTPAASRASFFACAVPDEPDTIAPAWPIVLPSGAVKPATYPTTGLGTWEAVHARARASHLH